MKLFPTHIAVFVVIACIIILVTAIVKRFRGGS